MANLLLRSPQYKQTSAVGMLSANIDISIDSILRYSITKNAINNVVVFDISEISRDYIEHTFGQSNPSETIAISTTITQYTGLNGTGTATALSSVSDVGYDGYGEFSEGINPTISTSSIPLQSNTDIYLPPSTASYIPVNYGDGSFETSAAATDGTKYYIPSPSDPQYTFTIRTICDTKFGSTKVTFVNKFGALQEMYFFFKQQETVNVTSENYKSNLVTNTDPATYSTTKHQVSTYNVNAKETISLNTPFVTDNYNLALEQLLLSEHIWLTKDGTTYPIAPKTKSLQKKTNVNDRLVQYTMEFEYAFDKINNVR
jgi:hypothetical protein